MTVRIGEVGHIDEGDDSGKYVCVEPLDDEPCSYLVLLAHDKDFTRGCGDDWVEDGAALDAYFAEARRQVSWGAEAARAGHSPDAAPRRLERPTRTAPAATPSSPSATVQVPIRHSACCQRSPRPSTGMR